MTSALAVNIDLVELLPAIRKAGVRFWRTFRAEILAGIALAAMLQIAEGTGLL